MNRYLRAKFLQHGEVRPFAASDALAVADLMFREHGYLRPCDPDALAAEVASGALEALVAVLPDGRIAGFVALRRRGPHAYAIAEAAVAAEAQETGLALRLAAEVEGVVRRAGAVKICCAQHVDMPGFAPSYVALGPRPSVVSVLVIERPKRPVALPAAHAPLLRRVYASLGLPREETPAAEAAPGSRGAVDVAIRERRGLGRVRVRAIGEDTVPLVHDVVEDLRAGRLELIEARVPLDAPGAVRVIEALGREGFVLSGVDPEEEGGHDEIVLARIGGRASVEEIDSTDEIGRALLDSLGRGRPQTASETADLAAGGSHHDRDTASMEPARGGPAAPPAPPPPLEMIEFARLAGAKQLVAGLCHEVNNPLNIILGSTYYLRQRAKDGRTDEVLPRLATIEQEVARVAKVLDNLRRFAHPEAAGRARIEVAEPIDEALALVDGELRHRGIELKRDVPGGLPAVRGNTPELEQVFFQLLRNALEASTAGGAVAIEVRAPGGGDQVVATVRDGGRGIAPEDLRRVFDPFFTTKETSPGAGLGLPIARAIVEAHGGRLRLDSRPGEGTTAIVELPAARERVERVEAAAAK